MYKKQTFGWLAGVILLDASFLLATQNTVANIPRKHIYNQNNDISGRASDGWPMRRHHDSKATKDTTNDVELTGHHGDGLTDDELEILLPMLIKNTNYPIISRKRANGSKKKTGHRGEWKQLTKSHPELSQIFGDKNPLVENHKSGKKLRQATEKHFQLVKHTAEVVDEGNYPNILSNTADKEVNYHLSSLQQNHIAASKIKLTASEALTTFSPHHRKRHHGNHGNHNEPSAESPASKNYNSDITGSEVKATETPTEKISEMTPGVNNSETDSKQYQKQLKEWRRKTTHELRNQPDETCDCENGGSCILRVACVCPKEYYGTRCQHKLHHHSCGDIRHGTWIRHGCTLCRCEDGNMLCMTKDIGDCDEVFDEEEVILEPETPEGYRIDAYILPPPTPSLDDIEVEEVDSDILVFEFEKLPLPSKANSISLTSVAIIFTSIHIVLYL